MANKEYPLTLVLRTVDRATAGLRAIGARVDAFAARVAQPFRRVGQSLANLGAAAGFPKLLGELRSLAGGVYSLGRTAVKWVGGIAVAAGFGVAALKGQVDELDALAKTADRLGLTVDALAELRFAAGQSGAGTQELDAALNVLTKNLGMLKAGAGELLPFLQKISPALLAQVQAATSTEEVLDLLADALAKLEDPTKRAALEAVAFGDSGQRLDNLLRGGSQAVHALRGEYHELAGSQEEAARGSEKVNDAMARVRAVFQGVRAAVIQGLAPAFLELAEKAKLFFVRHRADIARWAVEFGEKLPARVAALVAAFDKIVAASGPVLDALGGLRGMAIAVGAAMGGLLALKAIPALVSAIRTLIVVVPALVVALKGFAVALFTTPIGWIILAVAGLITAGILLVRHWDVVSRFFRRLWAGMREAAAAGVEHVRAAWDALKQFFSDLWDAIIAIFEAAWQKISAVVEKVTAVTSKVTGAARRVAGLVGGAASGVRARLFGDDAPTAAPSGPTVVGNLFRDATAGLRDQTTIRVAFENAPRGTRVATDPGGGTDVDLAVGYQMVLP